MVTTKERQQLVREAFLEDFHSIYKTWCKHAIPDSKGNVNCLANLECPTTCEPKNCELLRGILDDDP